MRASLFFWTIPLVIVTSPVGAESTAAFAAGKDPDINASCRIPFEALKDPKTGKSFALSALLNENAKLAENLRQRYIVADLNSTDENGNCRGVQEYFTSVGELSEFPRLRAIAAARKTDVASLAKESVEALVASEERPSDSAGLALELEDLQNYLQQVQRYKTDPVVKPSVVHGYCVGQTLSFCEVVDGQPKLVYRFVTSSWRNAPPPLYRLLTRGTGVRIADTVPPTPVATREWAADTLGSFPSPTEAVRSRCRTSCISRPWLAIRVCPGTASMRLPGVSTPAVRLGPRLAWDASVSTNSRPSWRGGGRRARRSFLCISSPIVTVLSETRPPAGPKASAPRRILRWKLPLLRRDRHIELFRTVQKTRLPHLAFPISQELWRADRFCKRSRSHWTASSASECVSGRYYQPRLFSLITSAAQK